MNATPVAAGEVLAAIADRGELRTWTIPGEADDACADSVIIGEIWVAGRRVAVILNDFSFQAGSLGRAAADRIVGALRTATALGLPVFASPASGGTRIGEGTPAFVKMIDIAAAARAHREAGGLLLGWLRHPTTGGTMATWGSLGQITFGQPGATAGFLGPRLFAPLTGSPLPVGVQTTDNLVRVGVIDGLVDLPRLRTTLDRVLSVVSDPDVDVEPSTGGGSGSGEPGLAGLLADASDVTELSGTGAGEVGAAVRLILARFGGRSCVLVGQDRSVGAAGVALGPAALRVARRGMALADELRLPLVTVIDTEGGELSVAAEEGAIAGEIARCLAELTGVRVPTVSLVLGAGCGGAALALLPADRVLATPGSWVAPLPLAGASLIRYRDVDHAAEMGQIMRISAPELAVAGIVDEVIGKTEQADAGSDDGLIADRLAWHLAELARIEPEARRRARTDRYGGRLRAVTPVGAGPGPGAGTDLGGCSRDR